ncbi:MAG: DUF2974 domain-containing protein [Ruminococcaceae bacterium]|nr:DUF2974 domain-containing protein [Oscillospiraceae bacterium]
MANINDYLDWRGDISFSELPPCEADALIFALLSYINFDGIVPSGKEGISVREAVDAYVEKYPTPKDRYLGLIIIPEISELLIRLPASPRYADVRIFGYVNEVCERCEMQFSAVSFELGDNVTVVAFRGTDDNIVGWKEDFHLSFREEVPSHTRAVEYLAAHVPTRKTQLYVAGHSKGGHLAVWGAVHSQKKIRDRIVKVYSLDGPGFLPQVIASEQYREMSDRITTLVPQSSLVGLLLDNDRSFQIVKSRKSGLLQHNPMLWEVMGGGFVRLPQLSAQGVKNDTVLREKIAALTPEEREQFTEVIFDILSATGAKTLSELNESKIKNAITVIKMVNELDRETRDAVGLLFAAMLNLDVGKKGKEKREPQENGKATRGELDVTFFPLVAEALKRDPVDKKQKGKETK